MPPLVVPAQAVGRLRVAHQQAAGEGGALQRGARIVGAGAAEALGEPGGQGGQGSQAGGEEEME